MGAFGAGGEAEGAVAGGGAGGETAGAPEDDDVDIPDDFTSAGS